MFGSAMVEHAIREEIVGTGNLLVLGILSAYGVYFYRYMSFIKHHLPNSPGRPHQEQVLE